MIHNHRWFYALALLLPAFAWVAPVATVARPQPKGRAKTRPLALKIAVGHPGASTALLVPVTGKAVAPDGRVITISGAVTVDIADAAPVPTPQPSLTINYVTDSPLRPVLGGTSTVTVVMTGTATAPVTMAVSIADTAVTGPTSVTLPAGASQVSFPVRWVTAVSVERYAAIYVTLGTVSKTANIILSASTVPTPTPTPVPGAVNPTINDFLNADGSPARVLVYGQEVRISGQGFGTQPGRVIWIGASVQVVSWTDTEVRVRLPQPKPPGGGLQFLLVKPDGGYSEVAIPSDLPARGGRR